jgi:hypothetical protein
MEKENAFAALLFGLLGGLIIIFAVNEPKNVVVSSEQLVSTIDSVWCTSPGQENTLQTDYRYYGKASNGQVIVSTDKTFHIGDSIVCVYYRYENTKTKKK